MFVAANGEVFVVDDIHYPNDSTSMIGNCEHYSDDGTGT